VGWSRDGKILFNRGRDGIYTVDADGSDPRRIGRGIAACWSPDGSQILYTAGFSGPLSVMDADGSHRRRIANVIGSEADWR